MVIKPSFSRGNDSKSISALEIFRIKGSHSYDFHIIYQSTGEMDQFVAILKNIDGDLTFSIFKEGKPLEKDIGCILVFF